MKRTNIEYMQFVVKYENVLILLSQHHENGANIEAIKRFFTYIKLWLGSESLPHVVNRIKEIRLITQRLLSGKPYQPSMVKTKNGLPEVFSHSLRSAIIRGDTVSIKIALTMTYVSRHWTMSPHPDFDPIITPNDPDISEVLPYIKEFIKDNNLELNTEFYRDKFHLSTKQGPNGQAIGNSLFDLYSMDEVLISNIKILNPSIEEEIDQCKLYSDSKYSGKERGYLRKVTAISDKELKTRIIAILDYWSQTALKPLHDSVMSNLKKFKCDFTMDQHGFSAKTLPQGTRYSYDLSNATDRFPINLQHALLKELIGVEKADAWKHILTFYEYTYKPNNTVIKYCAGQPMGAYSSWAVFSLCHHFILYVAARSTGQETNKNYMMLGDDIVIIGGVLADKYRLLMDSLKVSIADRKSFISERYFEFAKRSYLNGTDVTPYPIGAIVSANTSVELVTAIRDLDRKELELELVPEFIYKILRAVSVTGTPDWKIRVLSNKLRALRLWPLYDNNTKYKHTLLEFVNLSIPLPCGSLRLAEEKFLVALRRTIRASLIETCNTMNDWFDMISHDLSSINEDWETQNLSGSATKSIPLLVIKHRENEKFNDLLEMAGQEGFGGIGGFIPNVIRLILNDPRKLAASRSHLVISEMTTLLSQKTIQWLLLIRDKDIRKPIQPLQLSPERLDALAKRLQDEMYGED